MITFGGGDYVMVFMGYNMGTGLIFPVLVSFVDGETELQRGKKKEKVWDL